MRNQSENHKKPALLKAGVIGSPVGQSLSPLMHKYWFEAQGLNGEYKAIEVLPENLGSAVDTLKRDGFCGFNVTVPHKTSVLQYIDKITPLAHQMGAVNTVVIRDDGTTTGLNTDGIGFIKHLNNSAPGWPKDKPALLLGAGGAARAVALALVNAGVPMVMMCNRTRASAQEIADQIGRGRITVVDWEDKSHAVTGAGLIVNATTLGMVGQSNLDLELTGAASDSVVYDIVYKPLRTPIIVKARDMGLRTVDGLGMLVYQGAAAFQAWCDREVGYDDALRAELLNALGEEAAPNATVGYQ